MDACLPIFDVARPPSSYIREGRVVLSDVRSRTSTCQRRDLLTNERMAFYGG